MFEELRKSRTIIGEFISPDTNGSSIYLGLYNAQSFLEQIELNLACQTLGVPILVVDNCSSDSTWELIQPWMEKFRGRIRIVRNSINLGGLGSLLQNFDLIPSKWFITMHQDDAYFKNHVEVLARAASKAEADVACIATDMGSLDANGASNGLLSPPRAAWALPDLSPHTLFVSNLKLHNVPFPAASFRTSTFRQFCGPWHSTSFPDTEWVLKCLMRNRIELVPKKTMDYRENPTSESHTVTVSEGEVGTSLALSRVFSSPDFGNFARSLSDDSREDFAHAVFAGISARLGKSDFLLFVSAMAAEQLGFAFGYELEFVNTAILSAYGSNRPKNMTNLLRALGGVADSEFDLDSPHKPDSLPMQATLASKPKAHFGGKKQRPQRSFLLALNILPISIRRRAFKAFVNSSLVSNEHPWKARWRK